MSSWIERNLRSAGITKPTEIQEKCIPAALEGRDVLAAAQTGSGKTAAFAIPIVQRLQSDPYGVYALCLTPTRELALQITEQFTLICTGTALQCKAIIGGEDMKAQATTLSSRPHIVCATPGRLMEHLMFDHVIHSCFNKVASLVLDEADRLIDAGFDSEIRFILSKLPTTRQTLLFSATITPSICAMKSMNLRNVLHVELQNYTPVENCKQQYCFVPSNMKDAYFFHILTKHLASTTNSVIVFTNSIRSCELLHQCCLQLDIKSVALHSRKKQKQREESLQLFRALRIPVLIATDVASRGIDISQVELVINFDTPSSVSNYIHRIGRTARAAHAGEAITLVTQHDVNRFLSIEIATSQRMVEVKVSESEVSASLTQVLAAKRLAKLQLSQYFDTKTANRRVPRASTRLN